MPSSSSTLFSLLMLALAVNPLPARCETQQEAALRQLIQPHVMDPIDSVSKTPYLGLYEVRTGNQIVYTDATGSYLIFGEIVNANTSFNYTKARQEELNRIRFEDLPLQYAVKQVKGNGRRMLAVFEDPNCGYCKRLRVSLQALSDVTIYTFMYDILAPESATISRNIWCSPRPGKAWDEWMLRGKAAPAASADCKAPHEQVLAFGQRYGINATPTILFADGTRVSGALDTAALERRLAVKGEVAKSDGAKGETAKQ